MTDVMRAKGLALAYLLVGFGLAGLEGFGGLGLAVFATLGSDGAPTPLSLSGCLAPVLCLLFPLECACFASPCLLSTPSSLRSPWLHSPTIISKSSDERTVDFVLGRPSHLARTRQYGDTWGTKQRCGQLESEYERRQAPMLLSTGTTIEGCSVHLGFWNRAFYYKL